MPITLTWEQQKEYVRRVENGYRFQREVKALKARGASEAEIQEHADNFLNEWQAVSLLPGDLEHGISVGRNRSQTSSEK